MMVWMDQSDHTVILDTYYRYARVDAIHSDDDTVDITVLDGDGSPTAEQWFAVSVFIHCEPDAEQRGNGALKDGSSVFEELDTAVVKFEAGSPLVVARRDGLASCGLDFLVPFNEDGAYVLEPEIKKIKDTCSSGVTYPTEGDTHIHLVRCYGWKTVEGTYINVVHRRAVRIVTESDPGATPTGYAQCWEAHEMVQAFVHWDGGVETVKYERNSNPPQWYEHASFGMNWCKLANGFAVVDCVCDYEQVPPNQYKIKYIYNIYKYDQYGDLDSTIGPITMEFGPYGPDDYRLNHASNRWCPALLAVATDGASFYGHPDTLYEYNPKTDAVVSKAKNVTVNEGISATLGDWEIINKSYNCAPPEEYYPCYCPPDGQDGECRDCPGTCDWHADGSNTQISRSITLGETALAISGSITIPGDSSDWYQRNCDYLRVECRFIPPWKIKEESCTGCDAVAVQCPPLGIDPLSYTASTFPDWWWPYLIHMWDPIRDDWIIFEAIQQRQSDSYDGTNQATRTWRWDIADNQGYSIYKTYGPVVLSESSCGALRRYRWGSGDEHPESFTYCGYTCKRSAMCIADRYNCFETGMFSLFEAFSDCCGHHEDLHPDALEDEYRQSYREDADQVVTYFETHDLPDARARWTMSREAIKTHGLCS